MKAFYCDHFVLPLPDTHSFPMAKYRLLRERIMAERLVSPDSLLEPQAIAWEDLELVHTPAYLAGIRDGTLSREAQRRIGFPWSPHMVERARRSVGATLAAASSALETGGAAASLAGGTHHAFADRGEGYCVFNDVAVAARILLKWGRIARALVVDLDVHQGNGTAAVFRGDASVFTFSMHGARNFPFTKEQSDLDVMFEDGAKDDEYLEALACELPRLIDLERPDLVFYVAGADPYEGDRLGRLKLTIGGLRMRDRFVFETCRAANVPVAVTMAGGYCRDIDVIVTIHANTIREAAA